MIPRTIEWSISSECRSRSAVKLVQGQVVLENHRQAEQNEMRSCYHREATSDHLYTGKLVNKLLLQFSTANKSNERHRFLIFVSKQQVRSYRSDRRGTCLVIFNTKTFFLPKNAMFPLTRNVAHPPDSTKDTACNKVASQNFKSGYDPAQSHLQFWF